MTEPEWRPLPDAPAYLVSEDGQVRHRESDAPRKWNLLGRYPTVNFWCEKKLVNRTVHRLVAETFIGPRPPGMQIRHLDGNPLNNHVSNLRYGTAKENAADREEHNNTCRGERNGNSKIPDAEAEAIRMDYASGDVTQRQLARQYGVSQAQVNNIVLRKQRVAA